MTLHQPGKESTLEDLLDEAFAVRQENFSKHVTFSVPSFKHFRSAELSTSGERRFAALSVTGSRCALSCEHCRGVLLGSMIPAETPERLLEHGRRLRASGCRGVLVSGGCDARGRVELSPFHDAIRSLREDIGLKVGVHVGLIDGEGALALADTGADRVMLDLVGDRETARRVLHIDAGPERFEAALEAVVDGGLAAVPHVVVGLDFGEVRGEERAIAAAARHDIEALVLVVLRPEPGSGMAGCKPVSPESVAALLARARLSLPNKPLLLGCARPVSVEGRRIEGYALRAGVNGIAFPSDETVRLARSLGLETRVVEGCCSFGNDRSLSLTAQSS